MKEQYIKQVGKALEVARKQKKDILRDLEEAFSSAKEHGETEEQVIERLGTPEEFAAEMSELNAEAKSVPKKKVAAIICALAVMAVIIAFLAALLPELFKFGNPIPYLKAAMQLKGDTHVASIIFNGEDYGWPGYDEHFESGVMSDEYPFVENFYSSDGGYVPPMDVETYIWENFGVSYYPSVESEHGLAKFIHSWDGSNPLCNYVEVETFFGKYYVWKIPFEFYYVFPDNHELLDNFMGRKGRLYEMKRSRINTLLGEPKEVTDDSDMYYDCYKREVLIKYNEDGTVVQILRDGEIEYPRKKLIDESDDTDIADDADAVDEAGN